MPADTSRHFLRYVLMADAISSLACGVLQVAFTGYLSQRLGLSPTLLASTGDFLLLYSAVPAFLAMRTRVPLAAIWLLIVGNLGWGVACVGVLLGDEIHPTALGESYIAAQALVVLMLASLQYLCQFFIWNRTRNG